MPDARALWVRSDVAPDGTYIATVEFSDDRSVALDQEKAVRWAMHVLTACQRAEYDAAVYAQLTRALKMDRAGALMMIARLRESRPALDPMDIAPLRVEPGLSARRQHPFLTLHIEGQPDGQWEMADAKQHAMQVLSVVAAVPLDNGYFRWLGALGLDEARRRLVVEDLANWRFDAPGPDAT